MNITRASHYVISFLVVLLSTGVESAVAQGELSEQRWSEDAYGISLQPPLNCSAYYFTAKNVQVKFVTPDTTIFSLAIRHSRQETGVEQFTAYQPVDPSSGFDADYQSRPSILQMDLGDGVTNIDEAISDAIAQVGVSEPTAILLEQNPEMTIADRTAAAMYFKIPTERHGVWHMAIGMLQINPQTFAILEMRCDPEQYSTARLLFDAMFKSIEIESTANVNQRRQKLIESTETWRTGITVEKRHGALAGERWFRIIENKLDIGYMQVQQSKANFLNKAGVEIIIKTRIHLPLQTGQMPPIAKVQDTESKLFLSDDNQTEYWQIRTTVRPLNKESVPDNPAFLTTYTRVDSGVRDGDTITAMHDDKQTQWQIPPQGYISQVELSLLPQLLGKEKSIDMAFYSYHSPAKTLTLHTAKTHTTDQGEVQLLLRPQLTDLPRVISFDSSGDVVKWVPMPGRSVVLTTKQQLALKWKIR